MVTFVGDGGFSMLMMDSITAVEEKFPIRLILNNNKLEQIKGEQKIFPGCPEDGVGLEPVDFVKFAEACGGVGFRCDSPENDGRAMRGPSPTPSPSWSRRLSTLSSLPRPIASTSCESRHRVLTDASESDGTIDPDDTALIVVEATAGGMMGGCDTLATPSTAAHSGGVPPGLA